MGDCGGDDGFGGDVEVSALATAPMRLLLNASYKAKQPDNDGEIWCLNLDQIEPHSGKVLSKQMVNARDVGPSTYAFETGTVLYCKFRPYLNKVVVADADGMATTELVPLRCDASKVLPNYLANFLRSPTFLAFATNVVAGAKMPRMVMGEFWAYSIPLPPLEEQRRIAAILDQAETLRTQRRQALAHLDTLTQSLFLDMFGDPVANDRGWPRVPFGGLLEKIESGWSPVCLDRPAEGDEWAVLKLGAVTSCEFKPQENKALPDSFAPDASIEVKSGDLLFSRKNTYELVAACVLVDEAPPRLMMSDLIFRFRLNADAQVDPCYLHRLLIHPTKRQEVQKLAGGSSSSMPNISKAKLADFLIELPPLALQQTFATRIQAIEALKATHRTALAQLEALFASLQQRAFAGDL